ncbi:hypothetical protein Bca101_040627 [Brassica carinata]
MPIRPSLVVIRMVDTRLCHAKWIEIDLVLSTDKRPIVIFLAATEDAWLKLHKEVLSAVVAQNKRLIAIIKKQKEYVTKQDLQMLKDKIAEKITRAVPAIARKLMDDIKERQACDDESVAKLV